MADEPQPTTPAAPPVQAPQTPVVADPVDLTSQFKKDELKTAAAVQGVDVPASATKADIATAIVEQTATPAAQPVQVDGRNRRSDADALEGHLVDVVDGPHKGLWGVFERVLEYAREDGYPLRILVRNRDHNKAIDLADVDYAHARPSERSGGR